MKEIFEKIKYIAENNIFNWKKKNHPSHLTPTSDKFPMLHKIKPIPNENHPNKSNKSLSKCLTNGSQNFL